MDSGLLVMSARRAESFQQAVVGAPVEWTIAESCEAARQWLRAHPSPEVVVTDVTLRDGNWYCVFELLLKLGSQTEFLVAVPEGRAVSTILEHGVTAVVRRPFDHRAASVLESALREQAKPRMGKSENA